VPGFRAACADASSEVLTDAVRDKELCILGPSIDALNQPNLIVAKRLPMGRRGVLLVWRTVTDMAVQNYKGRPALCLLEYLEGAFNMIYVVRIADSQDVPAIT
jgi:hypothetical protein